MAEELIPVLPILSSAGELHVLLSDHGGYEGIGELVSIPEILEQCEEFDNTQSFLVLQTLYCKVSQVDDRPKVFYCGSGSKKVFYDEMLSTMGVDSSSRDNIIVFLIGKGRNKQFWSRCLKTRDEGVVGEPVYKAPFLLVAQVYLESIYSSNVCVWWL